MLKRFLVAKKLSPVKIGSQNGGFSEILGSKFQILLSRPPKGTS